MSTNPPGPEQAPPGWARGQMSPDDDGYIGYMLSDVARLIRTVFDRRVRDLGLTRAQWLVLTRLYRRPGASQTELADMLEIDRASAGRMIDRMEKGGWVERRGRRRRSPDQSPAISRRTRAESTPACGRSPSRPSTMRCRRCRRWSAPQFTGLAARVKEQLQSLAGADGAGAAEALPAPLPRAAS